MSEQIKEKISLLELIHPSPKQRKALLTIKRNKYTLYGGAMYGGKSYLLRWALVGLLIHYYRKYGFKRVQAGLFCEDYPTLKQRQLSKISLEFPKWLGTRHADHKDYGNCFILDEQYGGGVLMFLNLDKPEKYDSAEFAAIGVDELTKNKEQVFTVLRRRLRWTDAKSKKHIPDCKFIAGTNPGCFTEKAEVLTKNGWKKISEINVGEKVASLSDDRELTYQKVKRTYEYRFSGKLIKLNQRNGLRFEVTPNHKIVRRVETKYNKTKTDRRWILDEIQNFPRYSHIVRTIDCWKGKFCEDITLPIKKINSRTNNVKTIKAEDYLSLLGWFLSEGSLQRKDGINIAQTKKAERKKIEALLVRIGYKYSKNKTGFTIYSKQLVNEFSGFGNCREKFIPRKILDLDTKYLRIILDSLMSGDGHWISKDSGHYYTLSKQLSDDVCELLVKLGYVVRTKSRLRKNRKYVSYEVYFHKGNDVEVVRDSLKKINYSGKVYCLETEPFHNFLVRTNGSVWWSGNSIGHAWVKKLWMDKIYDANETEQDQFAYVHAKWSDNIIKNPEYEAMLNSMPEKLRKAFRDGNWDIFEGQYFEQWNKEWNTCKPFQIPSHWMRFIWMDYGYAAPASVHWAALDEIGRVYVYRELYGTGMTYRKIARKIWEMTPEWERDMLQGNMVADPAIFAKKGEDEFEKSGAEQMEEETGGWLSFRRGNNDRINGWGVMREYMKPFKYNGEMTSKLIFFDGLCPNAIRTIPALVYDSTRVEDLDSKGEDHAADGIRYGLMDITELFSEKAPEPPKQIVTTDQIKKRDLLALKKEKEEQENNIDWMIL